MGGRRTTLGTQAGPKASQGHITAETAACTVVSWPRCQSCESILFCCCPFSLTGRSPQVPGPGENTWKLCRVGRKSTWHLQLQGPDGSCLPPRSPRGKGVSSPQRGQVLEAGSSRNTNGSKCPPYTRGAASWMATVASASQVFKLREYPDDDVTYGWMKSKRLCVATFSYSTWGHIRSTHLQVHHLGGLAGEVLSTRTLENDSNLLLHGVCFTDGAVSTSC